MGLPGLLGAAGAYEGLKELLARRFQEQEFAEKQRATLAQEGLEGRRLDETAGLRRATMAATEQERLRDEQYRRDALAGNEAYRRDALAQGRELSLSQLAQAKRLAEMTESGRAERAIEGADLRRELAQGNADLRRDLADEASRRTFDLRDLIGSQQREGRQQDEYLFYMRQEQDILSREVMEGSQDGDPERIQRAYDNFSRKTQALAQKYGKAPGAGPLSGAMPTDPLGIR